MHCQPRRSAAGSRSGAVALDAGTGTFVATTGVEFCDYLRIPYERDPVWRPSVAGFEAIGSRGGALLWPGEDALAAAPGGEYRAGELRLFCRLLADDAVRGRLGDGWEPTVSVSTSGGKACGSIWRSDTGGVALPFDPNEAISNFWSEHWEVHAGGAPARLKQAVMGTYYRTRPLLPRRLQIAARRAFSRIQARRAFPRWPVEPTLHDLYDMLLEWLATATGEPVPYLAPWPSPYDWALVLTHDVEHAAGYSLVESISELEVRRGCRSAWYFVPERDYTVEDEKVASLRARGFEVGVHGLHHDGRDIESAETLAERLPAIRRWAERWGAVGFRSPATHRDWELMRLLGFDHDSSSFDTDPFEPQAGGCCTWWPFFNGPLVELPITLTMDHTLFVILRRDETLWLEKAAFLRGRGGMALVLTHPDYMTQQHRVDTYDRFLEHLAGDGSMWAALPQEVSDWWRRRAETSIVRECDNWLARGPAADEAAIRVHRAG